MTVDDPSQIASPAADGRGANPIVLCMATCVLLNLLSTAFAANFYSTIADPTPLHETPNGRTVGSLQSGVTVVRASVQGEWSEIKLTSWIHSSAFKGPAPVGGQLSVGAGMAMKGENSQGPEIGKIYRGSHPEMAGQDGDYLKTSITAWVKSEQIKPGNAESKRPERSPGKDAPNAAGPPRPTQPKPSGPEPDGNTPPGVHSKASEKPISFDGVYARSWGVCIGVGVYDRWPAVAHAAEDARAVHSALEKMGFDGMYLLTDKQATRQAIESLLGESLPARVGENDRVVIYFSGHGSSVKSPGGAEKGFLIPADCPESGFFSSAISMSRIREIADMIPAKHILFVFDACLADRGIASATAPAYSGERDLGRIIAKRGVRMIAACSSDARSPTMASHMLTGLDGAADKNGDGLIFASELGDYIGSEFARAPDARQASLFAILDGEGEIAFRRPDKKGAPRGASRADKPASAKQRVSGARKAMPPRAYKETFMDLNIEMEFIPGGSFERSAGNEVVVDSFWMGKYEITVGQWRKFLNSNGLPFDWSNNSFGLFPVSQFAPEDNYPIVNVSWHQATTFLEWLSSNTGSTYRLPTEAEWEYAARAGRGSPYATSTGELGNNLANCQGCGSQWDNRQTAPVGSFPPNPFGLHEMSGNAWEWCMDVYGDYPTGKQHNPTGLAEGVYRVSRGGSWNNPPELIRTSHRGRIRPAYRGQYLGFRIVCANDQK